MFSNIALLTQIVRIAQVLVTIPRFGAGEPPVVMKRTSSGERVRSATTVKMLYALSGDSRSSARLIEQKTSWPLLAS